MGLCIKFDERKTKTNVILLFLSTDTIDYTTNMMMLGYPCSIESEVNPKDLAEALVKKENPGM